MTSSVWTEDLCPWGPAPPHPQDDPTAWAQPPGHPPPHQRPPSECCRQLSPPQCMQSKHGRSESPPQPPPPPRASCQPPHDSQPGGHCSGQHSDHQGHCSVQHSDHQGHCSGQPSDHQGHCSGQPSDHQGHCSGQPSDHQGHCSGQPSDHQGHCSGQPSDHKSSFRHLAPPPSSPQDDRMANNAGAGNATQETSGPAATATAAAVAAAVVHAVTQLGSDLHWSPESGHTLPHTTTIPNSCDDNHHLHLDPQVSSPRALPQRRRVTHDDGLKDSAMSAAPCDGVRATTVTTTTTTTVTTTNTSDCQPDSGSLTDPDRPTDGGMRGGGGGRQRKRKKRRMKQQKAADRVTEDNNDNNSSARFISANDDDDDDDENEESSSSHFRDGHTSTSTSRTLLTFSEDVYHFHWFHVLHTKCPRLICKSFGPWCSQVTSSSSRPLRKGPLLGQHSPSCVTRETMCGGVNKDKSASREAESQARNNTWPKDRAMVVGGGGGGGGGGAGVKDGGVRDKPAATGKSSDVFDRLSGQAPPYVFRHHLGDVRRYMSEYRERYTVGNVCRKARRYPVIGVDVPDPYNTCRRKKPCLCIECSPASQPKMAAGLRDGASVHSGSSGSGKDNSSSVARSVPNLAPVRQPKATRHNDKTSTTSVPPPPPPPPRSSQPLSIPTSLPLTGLPTLTIQQESQRMSLIGQPQSLHIKQEPLNVSQTGQSADLPSKPDSQQVALTGQSVGSEPTGSQTTVLTACSLSSVGEEKEEGGGGCEDTEVKAVSTKGKKKKKKGSVVSSHSHPGVADTTEVTNEPKSRSETRQPITISVPLSGTKNQDREDEPDSRKEPWLPGIIRKDVSEKKGKKEVTQPRRNGFLNISLAQKVYESKLRVSRPKDHHHTQNNALAAERQGLGRSKRSRSVDFLPEDSKAKTKDRKHPVATKGGFLKFKVMSVDDLTSALDAEKGSSESWRLPRIAPLPMILDALVIPPQRRLPLTVREDRRWGPGQTGELSQHERHPASSELPQIHDDSGALHVAANRQKAEPLNTSQATTLPHHTACSAEQHVEGGEAEPGGTTVTISCPAFADDGGVKHLKDLTPLSELSVKNRSSKPPSTTFPPFSTPTITITTPNNPTTTTTTTSSTTSDCVQQSNKGMMGIRGRTLLDLGSVSESQEGGNEDASTSLPNPTSTTTTTTTTTTSQVSTTTRAHIPPLKSADQADKQSRCFPAKQFKRPSPFYRPPAVSPSQEGGQWKGRTPRRLSSIDPSSLVVTGGPLVVDCGPQGERGRGKGEEGEETGQEGGQERGIDHGDGDALPVNVAYRLPKEGVVAPLDRKEHVTVVS